MKGFSFVTVSSRVTNITCDGSVAKPEHAQCSHFLSMAEVSFLPSANTRKRASASREAYLKIEKDILLILEGYKLTTECLPSVMVSVSRGE